MPEQLPQIGHAHEGEEVSRVAVRLAFASRFNVRDEAQPDYGCDGSIELKQDVGDIRFATNRRASFQLKHSSKPYTKDDARYVLAVKNINYLAVPLSFYLLHVPLSNLLFFRWQRDIVDELNVTSPDWRQQKDVTVAFSTPVDEELLSHIAAEINAHYDQVKFLRDGPGLVRSAEATRLVGLMRPVEPFVPRSKELHRLAHATSVGGIAWVHGPPGSGKSELISHWITSGSAVSEIRTSGHSGVSVLLLDLAARIGHHRALRALSYALGVAKREPALDGGDDDSEPDPGILLSEILDSRLHGQRALCVIENAEDCLRDPIEFQDITRILAARSLRDGAALVVSHHSAPPDAEAGRPPTTPIGVQQLNEEETATLVRALLRSDHEIYSVTRALDLAPELRLPSIVWRLSSLLSKRQSDGNALSDTALLELMDEATQPTARAVLGTLGCDDVLATDGRLGELGGLVIMSMFSRCAIPLSAVRAASLDLPTLAGMREIGFAVDGPESIQLTPFGLTLLRSELKRRCSEKWPKAEEAAVVDGFSVLWEQLHATTDGRSDWSGGLEETLAWMSSASLGATALYSSLATALIPYVADDLVFPFTVSELEGIAAPLTTDLSARIAELTLAVRTRAPEDIFASHLKAVVQAAESTPRITASQLRVLDTMADWGLRRFRDVNLFVEASQQLSSRLLAPTPTERSDAGYVKWSISWILHAASASLTIGDQDQASDLMRSAREWLRRLPQSDGLDAIVGRLWLEARTDQLAARIWRRDAPELLRRATSAALLAFRHSDGASRWSLFALRSADSFIDSLSSDAHRLSVLAEVLECFEEVHGSQDNWPMYVRSQVGSLIRDVGLSCIDPSTRSTTVGQALSLLRHQQDRAIFEAEQHDVRALLVLARTYGALARCLSDENQDQASRGIRHQAIVLLKRVVARAHSPAAWELLLRLTDEQESARQDGVWYRDTSVSLEGTLNPNLRKLLSEAREWLETVTTWNRRHTSVAVWCLQREWRAAGALDRWAMASLDPETDWSRLSPRQRREIITSKHKIRRAQLAKIEKHGKTLETFRVRLQNESQFQRLVAVNGTHDVDLAPIKKLFVDAAAEWPHDFECLLEQARFYRYVWDYSQAIPLFREVIAGTVDHRLREDAIIDIAETLLVAAQYFDQLSGDDGTDPSVLLKEAQSGLREIIGTRRTGAAAALLQERVALELGEPVDWTAIDSTFAEVIGDVDSYLATALSNLESLTQPTKDTLKSVSSVVHDNWTDAEVLRSLGSLYLRRAELERGDVVENCRKAYAAFQACRIQEIAWLARHQESLSTKWLRARSIVISAAKAKTVNPFKADLERKRDMLHLAEALLQSCTSDAVGGFYLRVRGYASEASKLHQRLTS